MGEPSKKVFIIKQFNTIKTATKLSNTFNHKQTTRNNFITIKHHASTAPYTDNHFKQLHSNSHSKQPLQNHNGVHQEQRSEDLVRHRPARQGAPPICQRCSQHLLPSTSCSYTSSCCCQDCLLDFVECTNLL